jgi:hypothetical protein
MPTDTTTRGYDSLRTWQRWVGGLLGLAAAAAGAVSVFTSDNQLGSAFLLGVGLILLLVGVVGIVPALVRFGDNEVAWQQAAEALREVGAVRPGESVPEVLHELGIRYDTLRATLPRGPQRTAMLEQIALQARTLAAAVDDQHVQTRLRTYPTDPEGARVVTLGLLEGRPVRDAETASVIASSVAQPRSAFEQYHALRVATQVFPSLSDPAKDRVREATARFLADPALDHTGDREKLARELRAW